MTDQQGYWGKVTASIDWCESNYVHSHYIAETFNTVSNAFYLITTFSAIWRTYRSLRSQTHIKQVDMMRFYILYLFGLVVCIGSFTFHATLLKFFQLLDELPMLYGLLVVLFSFYYMDDLIVKRSRPIKTLIVLFFVLFGIMLTWMMLYIPNLYWPFLVTFGALVLYTNYGMIKMSYFSEDSIVARSKGLNAPINEQNKRILMWAYFITFIVAFSCWLIDNLLCSYVQALYLHSFWHLFTALCVSYMYDWIYHSYLVSNRISFEVEGNILFFPTFRVLKK